jgi:hypothetical protein
VICEAKRRGRCRIICPGKPENNAGDIVRSGWRKTARCFKRLADEFCHRFIIAGRSWKPKPISLWLHSSA